LAIVEFVYALCVLMLSIYGFNSLILTWVFLRHRGEAVPMASPPTKWPRVTVQLPIFNELHMVERLLAAAAALDYPRDRLQIQLLDDSTDETRTLAALTISRLKAAGVDAVHLARQERAGFKAGALAAGLQQATGELIAILDADFVPPSDFLRRVVPSFADPRVGCVQTRWGHMNRDYSVLTQTQALGMDGHFVVEQAARSHSGLFINFNGTAGVWRRTCIDDAGGWTADTLTEDLDLSYRAQLRGWRIAYLPDVIVPAELPAQVSAFKRQQARWAQGSIETALKLAGRLLRSEHPWRIKLEGVIHLTGYMVHPLMLCLVLLTLPMSRSHSWVLHWVPLLMTAAVGPPLLYAVAASADATAPHARLRYLPVLVLLGTGIALSNTLAVLRALLGRRQVFQRTPKFDLRHKGDRWVASSYALGTDLLTVGEAALAVFALGVLVMTGIRSSQGVWLVMYAGGFGYVASISVLQFFEHRRWLAMSPSLAASRRGRTR
jgi:cellulose synthase/poly-beta-1,6-N-acetylglucosamine synthase-like glycosyltransferase